MNDENVKFVISDLNKIAEMFLSDYYRLWESGDKGNANACYNLYCNVLSGISLIRSLNDRVKNLGIQCNNLRHENERLKSSYLEPVVKEEIERIIDCLISELECFKMGDV